MALEKLVCHVDKDQGNRRLDQFLAQAFPDRFSRRRIRRMIDAGAVYVDGKRVRVASRKVFSPARVELFVDERSVEAASSTPVNVLYEDDDLIAVDKPSGMPAQATVSDASSDLFTRVRRFLADRDGAPVYLALHHRLDRGTSGVMLFAKQRRANRGLAEAFAGQRVRKIYHALAVVTAQPPAEAWVSSNHLSAPRGVPDGPRRVLAVDSGGRPAQTEFRVLQWFPGAVRVEAIPKTGRTHQIRVHLADHGLPVLGDALYGRDTAPRIAAPRLMLHAVSLTLEHPVTGEALCVESPLPEDFRRQVDVLSYAVQA